MRNFLNPTVALVGLITILAAPAAVSAQGGKKSGHIEQNGVNYYYEIHGTGEPLLLLHGGLGSIDMFGPVLPTLAKGRQVIAVDLHGHGRTALGARPIDLVDMGHDMAGIVSKLGYKSVDVFGYSMGGGVALRCASPSNIRRRSAASRSHLHRSRNRGSTPRCCPSKRRSARRWRR